MKFKAISKIDKKEYYGNKITHCRTGVNLYGLEYKRFAHGKANFYYKIKDQWFLIDENLSVDDIYNIMLIEAQKKGFNNIAEAIWDNPMFKYNCSKLKYKKATI